MTTVEKFINKFQHAYRDILHIGTDEESGYSIFEAIEKDTNRPVELSLCLGYGSVSRSYRDVDVVNYDVVGELGEAYLYETK